MNKMKSAAEYLAQYNISMDFDKPIVEPKYPFIGFKNQKNIKSVEKVIKQIRPNYPEYDNTTLYKDKHCSMWTHVCEASLENGITPVKYVSQPLPLDDVQYDKEDECFPIDDVEDCQDVDETSNT